MSILMSDRGVCRTAPATPVLLNMCHLGFSSFRDRVLAVTGILSGWSSHIQSGEKIPPLSHATDLQFIRKSVTLYYQKERNWPHQELGQGVGCRGWIRINRSLTHYTVQLEAPFSGAGLGAGLQELEGGHAGAGHGRSR